MDGVELLGVVVEATATVATVVDVVVVVSAMGGVVGGAVVVDKLGPTLPGDVEGANSRTETLTGPECSPLGESLIDNV